MVIWLIGIFCCLLLFCNWWYICLLWVMVFVLELNLLVSLDCFKVVRYLLLMDFWFWFRNSVLMILVFISLRNVIMFVSVYYSWWCLECIYFDIVDGEILMVFDWFSCCWLSGLMVLVLFLWMRLVGCLVMK